MAKLSKPEVDYGKGTRNEHCGQMDANDTGYCKHFIERGQEMGACTIVAGTIGRNMWCDRFRKV